MSTDNKTTSDHALRVATAYHEHGPAATSTRR